MLFPYKRIAVKTLLTTDQATQAVSEVVQSSRRFWPNPFSSERRHFYGIVTREGFKVIRNTFVLNSFLPEIKGSFSPSGEGTTSVQITMTGNPCVIAAFVLVFGFFAWFLITQFLIGLPDALVLLGTLAGSGLGYLIYVIGFNANSAKDKDYLVALLTSSAGEGREEYVPNSHVESKK